jgi:ketosteroid isomerase-like protein
MLHRSAKVTRGQRVLIHGAAGGVGSALLQLGRLAELEMYGTCSSRGAPTVSDLGGIPIDYRQADFVSEIRRLTGEGVDAVFDGIGGAHIWRSRTALRRDGRVVAYGLTSSLRGGRLASGRSGRRRRFRAVAIFGLYIAGGWLLPGRRRVVPYSIQWLKRLKPALFRQDLSTLLDLLRQQKLKPLIAQRLPLTAARQAQELLGKEGVTGKIVLVPNGGLGARIRAYAAAWAARDRDAWLRTFAADATQEDPVGSPIRRGQREIGDFWDREMARYTSIEIVPREIFVIGHEAAMVWTINGVTEAGAVSFGGVDVFRFDDAGLISSVRAFWERDALHGQFQRLRDAKSSGR